MLTIRQRLTARQPASAQLVLPFELRQRSRLRAQLTSGQEVGLFLERGLVLRGGDLLRAEDGTVIEVVAALETVSTVHESDAARLARAGYHLGNRHVPVQIGQGWLRYGHDHVLDDMVRGLGLTVVFERAPFEPEAGAYGHAHGAHEHAQGSNHEHSQHEHAHGSNDEHSQHEHAHGSNDEHNQHEHSDHEHSQHEHSQHEHGDHGHSHGHHEH